MTRIPDVTGNELVRALKQAGWQVKSQKGSHVKLIKTGVQHFIIVPVHGSSTIPKGTLSNILRDAGLTSEELRDLL